ncbi:MAG: MFS transporter [Saprospiraceae bacterium]
MNENRRAIQWLMIANTISGIAQGISMLAIPWYFAKSGEANLFGWSFFLANIFMLFVAPFSGVLIDKYDRVKVFIYLFLFIGIIELSISAIALQSGGIKFPFIYLVFLLTFLSYSVHYPNLYALIQQITPAEKYGKLTSILEIQGQFSTIVAGALGAILLDGSDGYIKILGIQLGSFFRFEPWKIEWIFIVDAITYFLAALILTKLKFKPLVQLQVDHSSVFLRMADGWHYLWGRKHILWFGIFSLGIFATLMVESFTLLPAYVKYCLDQGAGVFAAAEIYYAVGALTAGLIIRKLFHKIKVPISILIMTMITAVGYILVAIFQSTLLLFVYSVILGLCNAGTRIQRMSYLFSVIPNQFMGRVSSIFNLSNIFTRIILTGIVSIPLFGPSMQVQFGLIFLGIFLLLCFVILWIVYKRQGDNLKTE